MCTEKHHDDRKRTKCAKQSELAAPLMVESLGVALRVNSHPMANRAMDVIPVTIRGEANRREWLGPNDKTRSLQHQNQDDMDVLADAVFAITTLRFTGRVSRYGVFYNSKENTTGCFLPTGVKDLEGFLAFLPHCSPLDKCKKSVQIFPTSR